MPRVEKNIGLISVAALIFHTSAFAQNADGFINLFQGVIQREMVQTARSEWRRIPADELLCLDQALHEQGATVDDLADHGVTPFDPRLSQLRANCRYSTGRPSQAQQLPYVVDGLALGGSVIFQSDVYKHYKCLPSEKFLGLTWCHKEKTERTKHGEVTFATSILHSADGSALYVNRYIEPAFFGQTDVRTEIDRLSAKFGERPRELRLPSRAGLPDAVIAVWGAIELKPLSSTEVSVVASGGSPRRALLVSFLGDIQRSAKANVPVFELAGGAGFLWAATFDRSGRGVLRFLTIDASQIVSSTIAVRPPAEPAGPSSDIASPTVPARRPADAVPSTVPGTRTTPTDATGRPNNATVTGNASPDASRPDTNVEPVLAKVHEISKVLEQKLPGIRLENLRRETDETLAKLATANADMSAKDLQDLLGTGERVIARLNEMTEFDRVSSIATREEDRIRDDLTTVVSDAAYVTEINDALVALDKAKETGHLRSLQDALSNLTKVYAQYKPQMERDRFAVP
jgi:hypothetical protein